LASRIKAVHVEESIYLAASAGFAKKLTGSLLHWQQRKVLYWGELPGYLEELLRK